MNRDRGLFLFICHIYFTLYPMHAFNVNHAPMTSLCQSLLCYYCFLNWWSCRENKLHTKSCWVSYGMLRWITWLGQYILELLNLILKGNYYKPIFLYGYSLCDIVFSVATAKYNVVLTYFQFTKGIPIIRPCEQAMRVSFVSIWKKMDYASAVYL